MSLLTVREVAECLGVSRTFVLRRVRSGDMPGFRLGGDGPLRFDWDEVERWARDSAGKILQNGDGSWSVRYYLGGRRRQDGTFQTRTAAGRHLRETLRHIDAGLRGDVSLSELVDRFLPSTTSHPPHTPAYAGRRPSCGSV